MQPRVVEVVRAAVEESDDITKPEFDKVEKLRYAQWKIWMAYAYLTFVSVLCVSAVLIAPTGEVNAVALALWGSSSAGVFLLLRREYGNRI